MLFSTVHASTEVGQVRLKLRECVGMALERHPDILTSQNQWSIHALKVRSALGSFLPQWLSSFNVREATGPSILGTDTDGADIFITEKYQTLNSRVQGRLPSNTDLFVDFRTDRIETSSANALVSPYYVSRLEVGGRQNLLQGVDWLGSYWGSHWQEYRIARAAQSEAFLALQDQIAQKVADIEMAYHDLLAATEEVKARQRAVDITKEQVDLTKERIQAGMLPPSEIFQTEERFASRRLDLLYAQQRYAERKQALAFSMGLPGDDPLLKTYWLVESPDKIPVVPLSELEMLRVIEVSNYSMRATRQKLEQTNIQVQIDKSRRLPVLDLEGAYFLQGGNSVSSTGLSSDLDELVKPRSDGWRVGVQFELPLMISQQQVAYRISKLQFANEKYAFERGRSSLLLEAQTLREKLLQGKELIQLARETVKLAEKKLSFEQNKFRSGLTTGFSLLSYQADLTDARIKAVDVVVDYLKALARLNYLLGVTLKSYGIDLTGQGEQIVVGLQ